MQVGLIGTGNIAHAIATGLGEPVICYDLDQQKAKSFAGWFTGSTVAASNKELATKAEIVITCHKPQQLAAVSAEIKDVAKCIVSPLAGVTLSQLEAAYPNSEIFRIMPNTAVATNKGTVCLSHNVSGALAASVDALLQRLGTVVRLKEDVFDVAMAISGVGPAYVALVAEAWVDAAVREGLSPREAGLLVQSTLAGTAELMLHDAEDDELDLAAMRRAVTSPGGVTAKGLRELERNGVREAFQAAMDAVLGR